MSSSSKNHILKALVCSSWGYEQAFEQYAALVKEKFPNNNLVVKCETYPLSPAKYVLSKIAWVILMLGTLSGVATFVDPQKVNDLQAQIGLSNGVLMGILLAAFIVQKVAGASGAFEIFFDDVEIFSKLKSGEMPKKQAFVDEVVKRMSGEVKDKKKD